MFHRGQGGLEKAGAKCSKGAKRFDDRTDAYGLGEPNYKVVDQMKVHCSLLCSVVVRALVAWIAHFFVVATHSNTRSFDFARTPEPLLPR